MPDEKSTDLSWGLIKTLFCLYTLGHTCIIFSLSLYYGRHPPLAPQPQQGEKKPVP